MSEGDDYYVSRRKRLLRAFDRFARRARPKLERRYGGAFAGEVLVDARRELELIIPRIPYIGGWRNAFTPVMIVNGWLLALHRAMTARGKSAEEVIRLCAEVSDDLKLEAICSSITKSISMSDHDGVFDPLLARAEAHRLFGEMGATGHAERLKNEIGC